MIPAMFASVVLVLLTVGIHYEALRLTSDLLPKLTLPPRQRMIVVLVCVFAAHTVEVWIYGVAYLILDSQIGIGDFGGVIPGELPDYIYFSTVTYTSLGYGDVFPLGGLRLVTGVESLNGLLLIGWSASFTYLAMQEVWGLHKELEQARRARRRA